MFGLIIVIIAIAVFALFMGAGSNYIDGDKLQAYEVRAQLNSSVSKYASGVIQFNLLFGQSPSELSHISPSLVSPPKMPRNMEVTSIGNYSVPRHGDRVGICFSANNVEFPSYLAVSELKDMFPEGQLLITGNCQDLIEISAPITYPTTFNFIFLVRD